MMSVRLKIIMVVLLVLAMSIIVNLIRKRKLELKYALVWMLLIVGLALLVLIPGLLEGLAALLGIYSVMNLVFFVGFVFSLLLIFSLTMSLSRNSERVRKIAQKIALNEYAITHADKQADSADIKE